MLRVFAGLAGFAGVEDAGKPCETCEACRDLGLSSMRPSSEASAQGLRQSASRAKAGAREGDGFQGFDFLLTSLPLCFEVRVRCALVAHGFAWIPLGVRLYRGTLGRVPPWQRAMFGGRAQLAHFTRNFLKFGSASHVLSSTGCSPVACFPLTTRAMRAVPPLYIVCGISPYLYEPAKVLKYLCAAASP